MYQRYSTTRWIASRLYFITVFVFLIHCGSTEVFLADSGCTGVCLHDVWVRVLLYADDGALVASSAEDLQYMLDVLKSYCANWRMFYNIAKTKVIKFESSSVQVGDIKFVYNQL